MTKNISIILLICKKEPNRTSRNKLEIELKLDRANETHYKERFFFWKDFYRNEIYFLERILVIF